MKRSTRKTMRGAVAVLVAIAVVVTFVACQTQSSVSPSGESHSGLEANDISASGAGTADSADGQSANLETSEGLVDEATGEPPYYPEGSLLPQDGSSPQIPYQGTVTDSEGIEYYAGRIAVRFEPGVDEQRARAIIEEVGCRWGLGGVDHKGRIWLDAEVEPGAEDGAIEELCSYEEVRKAWKHRYKSSMSFLDELDTPEAPEDEEELVFIADDNQKFHLYAAGFQNAWTQVKCNQTVTVAVFDSGKPKPALSDLETNIDYNRAYDAVYGFVNWGTDADGHGTAVAGVISAIADNGAGTDGASYNAVVLPVRISIYQSDDPSTPGINEGPTWEAVARGLDYILGLDDVPDVVNMSFGGPADYNDEDFVEVEELLEDLRELDVVVVAAAGNSPNAAMYPALFDGVVSVGAMDAPSGGVSGIVQNGGSVAEMYMGSRR